ncbi:MAG: hypothetical protein HY512_00535 [Candidatus Aenigmarchaeota archaeon]|nr:hypothetical protein [Candidatus Aenigmarchaeota archaeon]
MQSEPHSLTDFKRYVKLGVKDGRPYVFIERLLFYGPVRRMALTCMSSDWTDNGKPIFDVVVALPNKGHKLGGSLADFSDFDISCIYIEKGTKLDQSEFEIGLYIQEPIQPDGTKTASGRVSRKHLQIERELTRWLHEDYEPIAARRRAEIYSGVPLRGGELAVNDRHVELIKEAERPRALLVDGFVEDGKKALATAEMLDELGIQTVGLACVVELINWRGETYHGREVLAQHDIDFKSLVIYENGEFRNTASIKQPEFTVPEALDAQNPVQ